jgi:hypothetical protein
LYLILEAFTPRETRTLVVLGVEVAQARLVFLHADGDGAVLLDLVEGLGTGDVDVLGDLVGQAGVLIAAALASGGLPTTGGQGERCSCSEGSDGHAAAFAEELHEFLPFKGASAWGVTGDRAWNRGE